MPCAWPVSGPITRPCVEVFVALLARQQEFGGWFDLNPYEQFRTPFRETQWALIALSSLYPSSTSARPGWNSPLGPQPAVLRAESPARLIRDLERIWDVPDAALRQQVLAQLGHESPLVRAAACRTLGRVGDETTISGVASCLGDESKVVRRAAAEAVRRMGNRFSGSRRPGESQAQLRMVAELTRALTSSDDRTRRGATRLFAAHFRDLSQETNLLDPLMQLCGDRDPVVAMQAIKALVEMVVLAGRLWREKSNRRQIDRGFSRAASSLGAAQSDRGSLYHRRRQYPLPVPKLGSLARHG